MDNPADQFLIDLFLQLVAIDATSGREKSMAGFIRTYLAGTGITIEEDSAGAAEGGDSGNLICRYAGGGSVALLAHMDTVRSTADLKARVLADRITSDGTTILGADNRAGVALILSALNGVANGQLDLEPFTAVFTICEETTLGGSRHLELPAAIEMAFTFDTSLPAGTFISETYGAMAFTARVIGKASHAGTEPEKGINAIMVAARAIAALETGRLDEATTANVGKISGGTAINVVPAQATVDGEVRGRNTGHVEEVIQQFEAAFRSSARTAGAEVEFSAEWHFKPYIIKPTAPIYRRVTAAITKAGLAPRAQVTPGGSDANSVNAKGIPAVNLATGASNVHSDDEFILLADLIHARDILLALLAR